MPLITEVVSQMPEFSPPQAEEGASFRFFVRYHPFERTLLSPRSSMLCGFFLLSRLNRDLYGGASRDRTDGLVVANDALSQLSYSPTCVAMCG